MKKIFLSAIFFTAFVGNAQGITPSDALRNSMTDITGTARFRALSGAFGAVGGDLSAITINPAGSALFNVNSGSISLANFNTKNNSNYFGTKTSTSESALELNQLGTVFVFKNQAKRNDWKKIAIALGYENTNNLDNAIFARGNNASNSVSNYFLNYANTGNFGSPLPVDLLATQPGESISDLYTYLASLPNGSYPNVSGFAAQQAMLGYQAYLFDFNPTNNNFTSNVPNSNYYQEYATTTWGFNGKFTANIASQYKDKLFLGLNLNVHFSEYRKSSSVYESNNSTDLTRVKALQFDNELYTYGGGFSFNLGLIAKLTEQFRGGLSFESPTWYQLNDELSQRLVGYSIENGITLDPDNVNPQVINIYEPYNLRTPGKITGSLAYIFGKSGFLSFDYSLKDYSQTKYRTGNSTFFRDLNSNMSENFTVSNEFRFGGEYRIKQLSLRGGYRFEESPYKNNETIGDLMGFSTGLGYNFGGSRLDFAYSFSKRDLNEAFVSTGMNDTSRINTKNNTFVLSYCIDF